MPSAARPRRCTRCERRRGGPASDMRGPEQSWRTDEHHEEECDEPERVAVSGRPETGADRLDHPEQEPAPDGPDDAAHPAEDRHHEGLQGEDSAYRGED